LHSFFLGKIQIIKTPPFRKWQSEFFLFLPVDILYVMKKILLLILLLGSTLPSYSQNGDIQMQKSFWGTKFISDGKVLKPREVLVLLESNPEAYQEFKKAKTNLAVANVFGFIGGAMIGWPLGAAAGGGDVQWGVVGAGAGVVLLAIPFNSSYNKRAKRAIDLYNNKPTGAIQRKPSLSLQPLGFGAKLRLTF
jgi:hypothetical protein